MKNVLLLCGAVAIAAVVGVTAKSDTGDPAKPPALQPPSKASSAPLAPAAAEGSLAGEVREAIDVAEYTYLRLATNDGREVWAAVSKVAVALGSRVSIVDAARMTNFQSSTLKRTFDVIYFGNLQSPAHVSGQVSNAGGALPPGHPPLAGHGAASPPHGAAAPAVAAAAVEVQPATGRNAHVIAAVFAQRAALAGKPARVRGQIVKATPVQSVTYYRLRDGSSSEPGSAELVVASTAKATVGEVITFEGQVRTNVDVGIGFEYPVMLHDARRMD